MGWLFALQIRHSVPASPVKKWEGVGGLSVLRAVHFGSHRVILLLSPSSSGIWLERGSGGDAGKRASLKAA